MCAKNNRDGFFLSLWFAGRTMSPLKENMAALPPYDPGISAEKCRHLLFECFTNIGYILESSPAGHDFKQL